eukprot:848194-Amphidinium_carterae.1
MKWTPYTIGRRCCAILTAYLKPQQWLRGEEDEWQTDDLATDEHGVYMLEEATEAWESGEPDALSEEQAQAIYAQMQNHPASKYTQHRGEIQGHRLARGFPPSMASSSKGKSRGYGGPAAGTEKGKRDRSLQALIKRSRCARCGVIGHWARTCKAE